MKLRHYVSKACFDGSINWKKNNPACLYVRAKFCKDGFRRQRWNRSFHFFSDDSPQEFPAGEL